MAEEDALLTGQTTSTKFTDRWRKVIEISLFAWALIATIVTIILAVLYARAGEDSTSTGSIPQGKRNLIFMVSDGMGPTSLSLTRSFRQFTEGLPYSDALVLDGYIVGQSRTRSTSSLITDSAAGATAFSCGQKSYNGAISTLPDHSPCGTVMEAAKRAGYMTGLVVTTRITDATPACFAAHVNKREEEDRIAEQLLGDYPLGQVVDLMLGAGRCHFLPNTTSDSCRQDDKDLIKKAKSSGYQYIDSRAGFDGLKLGSAVKFPLLGLFADHDIPYEIDRAQEDDVYPSLQEMAETALKALSEATRDNEKGFFLMIEGSRIDHAGHTNDPVAQVHEVLAYDRAFQTVLEFLEKDTVEGVVVSTSDHETGGLATARRKSSPLLSNLTLLPRINHVKTTRARPLDLSRIPMVPLGPSQRLPLRRMALRRLLPPPLRHPKPQRPRHSPHPQTRRNLVPTHSAPPPPRHPRLHRRRNRNHNLPPTHLRALAFRRHGLEA